MKDVLAIFALLTSLTTPAFAQSVSPAGIPAGTSDVPSTPVQNQNGRAANEQAAPGNPYAPIAGRTPYTTEQCAHQSLSGIPIGTVGSAGTGVANSPNCN
jgi:hypothetical protein